MGIVNNFGNDIPVQLIVKYAPDKKCFPNDDGIDTLQKSFHILDYAKLAAWVGTFQGYSEDNPSHIFDVTINYTPELTDSMRRICGGTLNGCFTGLRVFNLPEGCGNGKIDIFTYVPFIWKINSYYHFEFGLDSKGGNCKYPSGKGFITPDRKISIEYWYSEDGVTRIKKNFIGRKIK